MFGTGAFFLGGDEEEEAADVLMGTLVTGAVVRVLRKLHSSIMRKPSNTKCGSADKTLALINVRISVSVVLIDEKGVAVVVSQNRDNADR